jgi:hypothetical protein
MNAQEIRESLNELETLTTKQLKHKFKLYDSITWKKHPIDELHFNTINRLLEERALNIRFTV